MLNLIKIIESSFNTTRLESYRMACFILSNYSIENLTTEQVKVIIFDNFIAVNLSEAL